MCKRDNTKLITVHHTGDIRYGNVNIDKCIADIVSALNMADIPIPTESSCCGHDEKVGYVELSDGRILGVFPDKKSFLKYCP